MHQAGGVTSLVQFLEIEFAGQRKIDMAFVLEWTASPESATFAGPRQAASKPAGLDARIEA